MADDGLAPLTTTPSLDGLDSEERVEAMVSWFLDNFEDPVHETPHDKESEWGYAFIHGGPYEAADYIYNAFPDATEEEHQEAIDQLESDSPVFAPNGTRILPPEEDYDEEYIAAQSKPLSARLSELQADAALVRGHLAAMIEIQAREDDGLAPIGHNRPPPEEEEPTLQDVQDSIDEVYVELAKPHREVSADLTVVERAEGRFKKFLKWVGSIVGLASAVAVTATTEGFFGKVGEKLFDYVVQHQAEIIMAAHRVAEALGSWAEALKDVI